MQNLKLNQDTCTITFVVHFMTPFLSEFHKKTKNDRRCNERKSETLYANKMNEG
jgi:hypothetical protein